MSLREGGPGGRVGGHHPIEPAVFAFAHRAAVEGGGGVALEIDGAVAGEVERDDGVLPGAAAVFGAQEVSAHKSKGANACGVGQGGGVRRVEQGPAIAGADDRAVVKLDHAGVLRAAERVGVDQLGLLGPGGAVVCGADQDEIAVRISVRGPALAEVATFRRAAEGHEQLPALAPHDGREGAVELVVAVDDEVLHFGDRRNRRCGCGQR